MHNKPALNPAEARTVWFAIIAFVIAASGWTSAKEAVRDLAVSRDRELVDKRRFDLVSNAHVRIGPITGVGPFVLDTSIEPLENEITDAKTAHCRVTIERGVGAFHGHILIKPSSRYQLYDFAQFRSGTWEVFVEVQVTDVTDGPIAAELIVSVYGAFEKPLLLERSPA
jgi:hypothetical protein